MRQGEVYWLRFGGSGSEPAGRRPAVVVQHDRFNRGIWSRLESMVRDWTREKEVLYIITGAVFDRDGDMGSRKRQSLSDPVSRVGTL